MSLVAYSDSDDDEMFWPKGKIVTNPDITSSEMEESDTESTIYGSNASLVPSSISSPVENRDTVSEESGGGLERISDTSAKESEKIPLLFSGIPRPVTTFSDVNLERREAKDTNSGFRRSPVKISIPSLLEYLLEGEEEEEQPAKKRKVTLRGSNLFSILPPPKSVPVKEVNRALVPNVLTKKAAASMVPVKPQLEGNDKKCSPSKHSPNKRRHQAEYPDSGDESGAEGTDSVSKDFFSLSKVDVDDKDKLEVFDDANLVAPLDTEDSVDHRLSSGTSHESNLNVVSSETSSSSSSIQPPSHWTTFLPPYENSTPQEGFPRHVAATNVASSSAEQPVTIERLQLHEEVIKRLGGPKYKRQIQEMEFIDINEDTIMPDSNEWLTKQLTIETSPKIHGHSHRKNDGPTTQQRRKHQITYLAFQAKEKELELKNQWSQNRLSRKQTQSKYGF